ncbi:hypothetical protein SCO70_00810 [Legionella pneumophila serogroup 3]
MPTSFADEELKDGMDAGPINEKVKLQLFVNSLGICAAPECDRRLAKLNTKLGECAHIVPRKVGSHPREDYETSLIDRSKDANLIYLCEEHHKIVDNPINASFYTAEILRAWKKEHEHWATRVKKNSLHLPPNINTIFEEMSDKLAAAANVSNNVIENLLESCEELLHSNLITEGRILLSHISLLLLKSNNSKLIAKASLLDALLLINNEEIPEAKKRLLQIIRENPNYCDAMLEYIELCDTAPEPGDKLKQIESLVRENASDHPRLLLIDLTRKYKKQEILNEQINFKKQVNDLWLNARLICLNSLFCDLDQKIEQRDSLLEKWQNVLPSSPRPHLMKVIFKTSDLLRSTTKKANLYIDALSFSKSEKKLTLTKNPLKVRDQIFWLMQEIKLEINYTIISGDFKDLSEIINITISLIEKCYFDSFIDAILMEFLVNLEIKPEQWKLIKNKIQQSRVVPSKLTLQLLFLQALKYDELYEDLEVFLRGLNDPTLGQIFQAIKVNDANKAAILINNQNDYLFSIILLQSIVKHELSIQLASLLEVDRKHQQELLFARIKVHEFHKQDRDALDLIASLDLDKAAPLALQTIERILYRNEQWHRFVLAALRLINFEGPQLHMVYLHAKLAMVYSHLGDDTNALKHAKIALKQPQDLGEETSRNILSIMGQALLMIGDPDQACQNFENYQHIKRSFHLLLEEADLYLKSNLPNKHERAISLILQAFEEVDTSDERLYLSPFALLVELANAKKILLKNELSIEDGLFVKLDGLQNNWFYIGEEKNLGAISIKPGTDNYKSLIHKPISDEINWPADRFSSPNTKRKILHIATPIAFLYQRSHEAMQNAASIGNAPIWSVQMVSGDGMFHMENLKKLFDEQFRPGNEFFETYISSPLPFSFLCKSEGGLVSAIGRLCTEKKGFIRCNNGTQKDIDSQKDTAHASLKGHACFMDGLSTLMLIESGLLETVIKALPNIGISTSAIRHLRTIAKNLEVYSSSPGRGIFIGENFEFRPKDKEREENFKNSLLKAAKILDKLPNKVIGKNYPKLEGDKNLDHILPNYFVDTLRYAQERGANILTDDALFVQAYHLIGESPIPLHFSSLSLIRALVENQEITWEAYLKYFKLLSDYRYHLLPILVDDMMRAILPTSPGGIIIPAPKNLSYFNLKFTLSSEYGVDDKTFTTILSSLFTNLISDDLVTHELANEVFTLVLSSAWGMRDKKLLPRVLFQICYQSMPGNWTSLRSRQKLESLREQLTRISCIAPLAIELPSSNIKSY